MLTETQKKACKMLFENQKVQDVAEAVGVHRCTVWRWTQTRDFKKEWTRLYRNFKRRLDRSVYRAVDMKETKMRQIFDEQCHKAGISDPNKIENLWANAILDECLRYDFPKRRKH